MNKTVFWDLDDTLVHSTAFLDARDRFANLMVNQGFEYSEADELMDKVDTAAVTLHGFGSRDRFGSSMIETYSQLCKKYNKLASWEIEVQLTQTARIAYMTPSSLIEGAIEALRDTKYKGYKNYIVTKGNHEVQEDKIIRNGLDVELDGWFIFDHKTVSEMYDALRNSGSAARHSFFVGNSPRSDVNPAYLAGMGAIYIPHPTTWKAELEPVLDGITTVRSLKDVCTIIA